MKTSLIYAFCGLIFCSGGEGVRVREMPRAPSISVSPSWRILLGGWATIHCSSPYPWGLNFYLFKDGSKVNITPKLDRGTAHFSITNVGRHHGGLYSCYYYGISWAKSKKSEHLELLIIELIHLPTCPWLTKPIITLRPPDKVSVGSQVTIQCQATVTVKRFYLVMVGQETKLLMAEPEGRMVTLFVNDVSKEHGGSYHCSYRPPVEFLISEPSNAVHFFVSDADLPRPVISISPRAVVSLGEEIKFQCKTQDQPAKFYLQKAGDSILNRAMRSTRNVGHYSISSISWEHAGLYSCSYALFQSPFLLSAPSDDIFLLILSRGGLTGQDQNLPKPNISLSPAEQVPLGRSANLSCKSQDRALSFYFQQRAGRKTIHQQLIMANGNTAKLGIHIVKREHGGKYSCSYHVKSEEHFVSSELSDDVELQITDPSLTKPRISISPSGSVALGGEVKVWCEIQYGTAMFYLYKAGDPTRQLPMKSHFNKGEFYINNVSWKHKGNYSCVYAFAESPFLFSPHSDLLKLQPSENGLRVPVVIAVCLAVFFLLLSFGAVLWYKKKRDEKLVSVPKSGGDFKVLKPYREAKPARNLTDGESQRNNLVRTPKHSSPAVSPPVIYAELKQKALETQTEEDYDSDAEDCVYTTVVTH